MASEFEVFAFDQKLRDFDANMIDHETAVAVLFHDLNQELPWPEAGLRRKPFYIGALGSKRTHERRCQTLRDLGYSPAEAGRIKAPIGLFGPTRDANALALSVVAEVAQAFSLSQN